MYVACVDCLLVGLCLMHADYVAVCVFDYVCLLTHDNTTAYIACIQILLDLSGVALKWHSIPHTYIGTLIHFCQVAKPAD